MTMKQPYLKTFKRHQRFFFFVCVNKTNFIEIKTIEHFHSIDQEGIMLITQQNLELYNESSKNDIHYSPEPYNKDGIKKYKITKQTTTETTKTQQQGKINK